MVGDRRTVPSGHLRRGRNRQVRRSVVAPVDAQRSNLVLWVLSAQRQPALSATVARPHVKGKVQMLK